MFRRMVGGKLVRDYRPQRVYGLLSHFARVKWAWARVRAHPEVRVFSHCTAVG